MAWLITRRSRQFLLGLALTTSLGFSGLTLRPSFAQSSPEKQIERYLQEAQAAEKKKDYDLAVTAYQNILKLRPQWALIHQSLGVVYHLHSRFPEAISSLQKALKLDPSLWGSQLFLGMAYYRTNQFMKAIPALQQSLKLNPKLAENEARLWLGSSYLALNRFEEALTEFRRLSEIKPRDLEALYNLAEACNRYSSALFEKITVSDPASPEAHRLQAEWFEWQDKPDEAIGEYVQVLKARPEWEGVNLAVGNLYLRKGEPAKAAEALEQELRFAPRDPVVIKLLQAVRARVSSPQPGSGSSEPKPFSYAGRTNESSAKTASDLFSQGVRQFRARDFAGALDVFSRATQANPGDALAKLYVARCHFALGDFDRAIEPLKQPREFGRYELEASYWAGKSYQELAAQTLEKMIGIDPNSYRVHQMTGALLEDKRKYAEAIDAYQKALKPFPELMGLRFAIGNTYWKMQNLDEALVWLKDELARNPYHALANYKVGSIYLSKGNTNMAVPFLEKAVQANPTLLGAQQDLAKAYTTLGRHEEAIAKLKLVAQADPEDASIRYLLSGAYKKVGKIEAAEAELKAFTQLRAKQDRERREYLQKRISPDQPAAP